MKNHRIGYRQQQVLDLLEAKGEMTARAIQDTLNPGFAHGCDWVWKKLNPLRQRGLVVQTVLLDKKGQRTKQCFYRLRQGDEPIDQTRWPKDHKPNGEEEASDMLTITITGPPKSGKTSTAVLIAAMLQNNGHRVQLVDNGPTAHDFNGQFEDDDPEYRIITEQR